jgi:signal peptidase II
MSETQSKIKKLIDRKKLLNKENIFNILLIIIIFLADRLSKNEIISIFSTQEISVYINNFLNFDLVWNQGLGFGIFNLNAGIGYHLFSILIFTIILVIIYLGIKSNSLEKISYSSIIGGALGNLYDRVTYFAVPDFIDFHIDSFHWFTFNIADIFISIGVLNLLIIEILINKKNA